MENTVSAISLHVGQMILGNMVTSFNVADKKFGNALRLTMSPVGVDIFSKEKLVKTIPYSNIQGIDYEK